MGLFYGKLTPISKRRWPRDQASFSVQPRGGSRRLELPTSDRARQEIRNCRGHCMARPPATPQQEPLGRTPPRRATVGGKSGAIIWMSTLLAARSLEAHGI
jgi:hypothetical protein